MKIHPRGTTAKPVFKGYARRNTNFIYMQWVNLHTSLLLVPLERRYFPGPFNYLLFQEFTIVPLLKGKCHDYAPLCFQYNFN